jgi:N-acetyl-1-D-myo-inositol-2-amino-2-deoxy-alpha-D-glucopyranoside deacetylase
MSEGETMASMMGIWAHPDDEAFGTAGTMARAIIAGHPVAVVCATRGEEGEIADPQLANPENLGQVREQELRRACSAVGVTDVSFLDYRDGHLREADPAEATGRIVRHIRRFRPDVVVTFAANGGYGHYDHMAVHQLALAAISAAADEARYPEQLRDGLSPHRVRKVYFGAMPRSRMMKMRAAARASGGDFTPGGNAATIPIEEMGTPDERITTVMVLNDEEFSRKLRALQAHATQMPKDSPWSQATPEQLREFMGRETLELVPAPISERNYPTPEDDVFSGL